MRIAPAPALVLLLTCVVAPARGAEGPLYAKQVGYFSASVGPSATWELHCDASDPDWRGPSAIASGTASPDGSMIGSVFYFPRWSNSGRFVQVGDQRIVLEARKTEAPNKSSTFRAGGSRAGGLPGTLYVAWAQWGSPATCTATVDGQPRPMQYLDGSHAFLVGPESFSTGVFAQDGRMHLSAARTYITPLKGGPSFAHLKMGNYGEGTLHYDDDLPGYRECRQPYGSACDLEAPSPSRLTATVLGAYDFAGGSQGEMIVITLPSGI